MAKILVFQGVLLGLCAVTALPAHASSTNVTGQVGAGHLAWYPTARTITAGGSDIYLRVTSSPVDLKVWWCRCGQQSVSGNAVVFPAGSSARRRIGSNFRAGTRFCLGAAASAAAS